MNGAGGPPLRIALVHPFSWPEVRRGGERYLADLASYLDEVGHHVEIVTGSRSVAHVDRGEGGVLIRRRRHIEHPWLAGHGLGPIETFGVVALRHLARRRYDVVHALTPTAAVAGRMCGHPTLYTVLGQPDRAHFDDNPLERRITAAAFRAASEVAALSGAAAEVEQGIFGRRPIVLSPGVRMEHFPPDLAPRNGPPRILFPGDASDPRKHVDLALAAMAVVLERHPEARLVLGGPGAHEWALEGLGAERRAVLSAVDVLGVGGLDDVPRRYREATVTLLPSTNEAFGLGVLESLACGTPAVALAGGGPEEIIESGVVGVVAQRSDPLELGAAVNEAIELARDPAIPSRCVERARHWDWSQIGSDHVGVYRRLARLPS